MKTIEDLKKEMPWAVPFVRGGFDEPFICLHGGQLIMCVVCGPACETAYLEWCKENLGLNKGVETPEKFDGVVKYIYRETKCNNPITERFIREVILDILLFDRKQSDYGSENIAEFGEKGVLVRVNDKVARLKNLLLSNKSEPKNESVLDSWQDLSIYGVIARLLRNGEWK